MCGTRWYFPNWDNEARGGGEGGGVVDAIDAMILQRGERKEGIRVVQAL